MVAQHRLDGGGFKRLDADDGLDQELLAQGAAVEALVDLVAQDRADREGDDEIKRDRTQDDERERR